MKRRRKHFMYASLFLLKWFFILLMYYHLDTHMQHGAERETQITAAKMERFLQDNPEVLAAMVKEVLVQKEIGDAEMLPHVEEAIQLLQPHVKQEVPQSKTKQPKREEERPNEKLTKKLVNTEKEKYPKQLLEPPVDQEKVPQSRPIQPEAEGATTTFSEKLGLSGNAKRSPRVKHNVNKAESPNIISNKKRSSDNILKSNRIEGDHKAAAQVMLAKEAVASKLSTTVDTKPVIKGKSKALIDLSKDNEQEKQVWLYDNTAETAQGNVDSPKVDPPKVDPLKVDSPKVDPPKIDPPKVVQPKVNPPQVDERKVDSSKVNMNKPPVKEQSLASKENNEVPKKEPTKISGSRKFKKSSKKTNQNNMEQPYVGKSNNPLPIHVGQKPANKPPEAAPSIDVPLLDNSNKLLVSSKDKSQENKNEGVQLLNAERQSGNLNEGKKTYDKVDSKKLGSASDVEGHNKQQKLGEETDRSRGGDIGVKKEETKGMQQYQQKKKVDPKSPGNMGMPVYIKGLSIQEERKIETRKKMYGFNVAVSDKIGLERTLPDFREPSCMRAGRYSSNLPSTSIVICFCNEPWSSLLRTVHSVLSNTPDNLIQEILLIDDYSTVAHLKSKLGTYVAKFPKVKLVRSSKREGIIAAKNKGVRLATASVVTFLDPHCEVSEGWLEPLLDVMVKKQNIIAIPVMETINEDDFSVQGTPCAHVPVGSFDWTLQVVWSNQLPLAEEGVDACGDFLSPTLMGGIFTIHREYFEELGYFDGQIQTAREQDLDLSFKTWMCGSGIDIVPCSHVGHIYRIKGSQTSTSGSPQQLRKTKARVASIWMDDYAEYVNQKMGFDPKDAGDIEDMVLLKDSLQCKSFRWYMNNVQPDIYDITKALWYGEVKNQNGKNMCIDSLGKQIEVAVGLEKCHGTMGNQYWSLTRENQLRQDHVCVHVDSLESVELRVCDDHSNKQKWMYDSTGMKLHHPETSFCLGISKSQKPAMYACNSNQNIFWKFQFEGDQTQDDEFEDSL